MILLACVVMGLIVAQVFDLARLDAAYKRIERLELLMNHICRDKSDDV